MGFFRKMFSVSTLGLVDFWSDKERIARYTKQTRNAARANVRQNMKMIRQQDQLMKQVAGEVPPPLPAGWYQDPQVPDCVRWWDGSQWTPNVKPNAEADVEPKAEPTSS